MRLTLDNVEKFNDQENESDIKITYIWKRQTATNEEIECTIDHYPISNSIREIKVTGDASPTYRLGDAQAGIKPIRIIGRKTGNSPIMSAYIELSYKQTSRTILLKDGRQAFIITACGGSSLETEVTYSLSYPPLPRWSHLWYRRKIDFFEKTSRINYGKTGFKETLAPGETIGPIIGVVEKFPRLSRPVVAGISGLVSGVTGLLTGVFWDTVMRLGGDIIKFIMENKH